MAAPPTPKPRSGTFNELYRSLGTSLDAPTLVVLLFSALDRGRLEAMYNRIAPRDGPRAQVLGKEELVGAVGGWFFSSADVAHTVVRELDRVCKKERHIVASLPDGEVAQRLERYQALDFRRERAKLAWALLRDDRAEAQQLAGTLLGEMVEAAQGAPTGADRGREAPGDDDTRAQALRERLEMYETMVDEARGKVRGLEGQVAHLERERAELMVSVGRKENALRAEEAQRREVEERLAKAERRARELEEERAALDPEEVRRLIEERNRLEQRLRRMEKKGRAAEELERLAEDNAQLRREVEALTVRASAAREERQGLLQTLVVRERATQERMGRLREALKTARRMANAPREGGGEQRRSGERVGLFVDAANLGASAMRAFGGPFDFATLLELVGERERVVTIAYAVDHGEAAFERFANALREMGFTVKVKKPSRRPDGSVKADWDMAIAMDVIDARHRVDTVLIASGDGDFVPLVRRLRRWRKRVEVAAFRHAIHPELQRTVDQYYELSERQRA